MAHALKQVETPSDWEAAHGLREAVLFTPDRHGGTVYDRNHPDDRDPAARLFLLWHDGAPVGTVRLDLRPAAGIVRLVAIAPQCQGQGHGRQLDRLVGDYAIGQGVARLLCNAAPTAVAFYERCGWQRESWDPTELVGIAADCVQMSKRL